MAEIIDYNQLIHLRKYPWVEKPKNVPIYADYKVAKLSLNIDPNKRKGAFSWLSLRGSPFLTYVDSSHITHLQTSVNEMFPELHKKFMRNAS